MGMQRAAGLLTLFFPFYVHASWLKLAAARLYQFLFVIMHYNYSLHSSDVVLDNHFTQRIYCKKEHCSGEMERFLKHPNWDELHYLKTGRHSQSSIGWIEIAGRDYIVKRVVEKGFCRSLLKLNKAVTIWNNAQWGKEMEIPVLDCVALVEKRLLQSSEGFVLFEKGEYDGRELIARGEFPLNQLEALFSAISHKRVIHTDLKVENLISLRGKLLLIDIDYLHYYPKHSSVYSLREKRERSRLLEGISDHERLGELLWQNNWQRSESFYCHRGG